MPLDHRSTRAWRKLKDQVVREEPVCWLRFTVCTYWSQTADHVHTVKQRPDLAMERTNLRGACHACNQQRNDKPVELLPPPYQPAQALAFFDDD